MAHGTLMVSIVDGKVHLLRMKRGVKSYQPDGEPVIDADPPTVEEMCKRAHEIIVTSNFPSGKSFWGRYPKVGRHYLKEIVVREARQKFNIEGNVRAAFHSVGLVSEERTAKRLLACTVVDHQEVADIENRRLGRFREKIKHVVTLPAALCALVAHTETPKTDFMVVSVGEGSITLAISSPSGDVKVARQRDIGFARTIDPHDAERCSAFFSHVAEEIVSTQLYYLQEFQGAECKAYFMFGEPALKLALDRCGRDRFQSPIQFGLKQSPFPGLDDARAAA